MKQKITPEIDWNQIGNVRLFLKAKDFRQGSGGNVEDRCLGLRETGSREISYKT